MQMRIGYESKQNSLVKKSKQNQSTVFYTLLH